jgi:hypothetical protein
MEGRISYQLKACVQPNNAECYRTLCIITAQASTETLNHCIKHVTYEEGSRSELRGWGGGGCAGCAITQQRLRTEQKMLRKVGHIINRQISRPLNGTALTSLRAAASGRKDEGKKAFLFTGATTLCGSDLLSRLLSTTFASHPCKQWNLRPCVFRRSVAGFLPRRPGFESRSGHLGSVVDRTELVQVSSEYFCQVISPQSSPPSINQDWYKRPINGGRNRGHGSTPVK